MSWIVIGEVCDGVVFDFMKVWNIGYPGGFMIIYVNSVVVGVICIDMLICEVSVMLFLEVICEVVDLFVLI